MFGEWCYRFVSHISTLVPPAAKQRLRSGVLRRVDGLLEDTCIPVPIWAIAGFFLRNYSLERVVAAKKRVVLLLRMSGASPRAAQIEVCLPDTLGNERWH